MLIFFVKNIYFFNMRIKIKKLKNVSLKNYTTFHIGGIAKKMFFPQNEIELAYVFDRFGKNKNIVVLGNGSNILFTEKTYQTIVCMKDFSYIFLQNDEIVCGAGTNLSELCKFCENNNLTGLEFCCGIPGTVGGAICMNAGAFGSEICEFVSSFSTFKNGEINCRSCLDFSYRKGPLSEGEILLEAKFKLKTAKKEEIIQKKYQFFEKRSNSQPVGYCAGSVFKRGENFLPAKLIDEWGLKGIRVGGATISNKHAGFVVNERDASPQDVLDLIEIVEQVAKNHGFCFEREIKIV